MNKKHILALGLALTLLCGVLPAPAMAAEESKVVPFVDIQDPQLSEAAEFLRLVGVVDGTGENAFTPDRILTRAEFCKMAVELMGNGDKAEAQMNRTVFMDVPSTHWARGYINVATQVTGSGDNAVPAIIRGDATGCFHPDDPITCAEAVTILMRVLGYTDGTVGYGVNWYDGYMNTAASIELTDGVSAGAVEAVTRGQTALLLYNLYFTKPKDSKDTYLVTRGGSEVEGGIVLDVDDTADDGTRGAFRTTKDVYKTRRSFDPSLEGKEGKVILDKDGKAVSFVPKEGTTQRLVNVASCEATYLMAEGGDKLTVEPETKVYREGKETAWKDVWADVTKGTPISFHYGANGKVAYLFFREADAEDVETMVARALPGSGVNPFSALTGSGSYTLYKNGMAATAADERWYDVATWDPSARMLQVSDLKLTGVYEDASPSPAAPITIKVMGRDFRVLPSAREDLASFRVGDQITLLLTTDDQVGGVVSAQVVKGNAVGVAAVSKEGEASVKLLQGELEVKGKVSASSAERYDGQLVNVTSNTAGRLSLSLVSGTEKGKDSLDVAGRTLGDRTVAENVVVYDRVKDGKAVRVSYEALTAPSIPKNKISFVSYDYAGRVNYLVLNDATGDVYEYGYFTVFPAKTELVDDRSKPIYERDEHNNIVYEDGKPVISGYEQKEERAGFSTVGIRHADESGKEITTTGGYFSGYIRSDTPGGIAYDNQGRADINVSLQSLSGVKRSDFDLENMTVTVAGAAYPISDKVQCYNKTTKTWFKPGQEGLEAARAYSDDLTLYYDRSPAEGGKIRMIVIDK